MEKYSAHWRATILAAIGLHLVGAFGMSFVLTELAPIPKIQPAAEVEWVDVEPAEEAAPIDEETIPSEAEAAPTFNASDLTIPPPPVPAPTIEPFKPPATPEVKPIERPKPKPPAESKPTTPKPAEPKPAEEPPKADQQRMATPPVTINAVYPERGSLLGFKGYISIAVHIGKDGKVKSTEVLQSSGRHFVDEIVCKSARQWTFRPALDQIGRPMPCDKIITFDLRDKSP